MTDFHGEIDAERPFDEKLESEPKTDWRAAIAVIESLPANEAGARLTQSRGLRKSLVVVDSNNRAVDEGVVGAIAFAQMLDARNNPVRAEWYSGRRNGVADVEPLRRKDQDILVVGLCA